MVLIKSWFKSRLYDSLPSSSKRMYTTTLTQSDLHWSAWWFALLEAVSLPTIGNFVFCDQNLVVVWDNRRSFHRDVNDPSYLLDRRIDTRRVDDWDSTFQRRVDVDADAHDVGQAPVVPFLCVVGQVEDDCGADVEYVAMVADGDGTVWCLAGAKVTGGACRDKALPRSIANVRVQDAGRRRLARAAWSPLELQVLEMEASWGLHDDLVVASEAYYTSIIYSIQ